MGQGRELSCSLCSGAPHYSFWCLVGDKQLCMHPHWDQQLEGRSLTPGLTGFCGLRLELFNDLKLEFLTHKCKKFLLINCVKD